MKNIGLDFGTTNSTLSYIDPDEKLCCYYRIGRAGETPYIPSVVRFNRKDDTIGIGNTALLSLGDEDYEVYFGFKMLIGEKDETKLKKYNYIKKSPYECSKAYIKNLIESYCYDNNFNPIDDLEQIVISVPEIWLKKKNSEKKELITRIFQELNYPLPIIVSEPFATCYFFINKYSKKNNINFSGYALICNCGGGSIDFSLSKIDDNDISVLETEGIGMAENTIGEAGMAFDEAVILKLYNKKFGKNLSVSEELFIDLISDFEKKKIHRQNEIDKALDNYFKKNEDQKIFSIRSTGIKLELIASDLIAVFNDIIKPKLLSSMKLISNSLQKHNVDVNKKDSFCIVLAGGFSRFYLIRKTVNDFFNSTYLDNEIFNFEDIALSISKGASLIANNQLMKKTTSPVTIGLHLSFIHHKIFESDIKVDIPILKKEEDISQFNKPVFCENIIISENPLYRNECITFFIDDDKNRQYINISKQINDIISDVNTINEKWKIGFSLNENEILTMYINNSSNIKKEVNLGKLKNFINKEKNINKRITYSNNIECPVCLHPFNTQANAIYCPLCNFEYMFTITSLTEEEKCILEGIIETLSTKFNESRFDNAFTIPRAIIERLKYKSKVIIIAGLTNSGKSTISESIYKAITDKPFAGYKFNFSDTKEAFEERLRARIENPNYRSTKYISNVNTDKNISLLQRRSYLHMQVSKNKYNQAVNEILFFDLPGEIFEAGVKSRKKQPEELIDTILQPDHFVLLIDGNKLDNINNAFEESISLFQKCIDAGIVNNDTYVEIIISKWDLIVKKGIDECKEISIQIENLQNKIKKRYKQFLNLNFYKIAAEPEINSELSFAYGLENLFPLWARPKMKNTKNKKYTLLKVINKIDPNKIDPNEKYFTEKNCLYLIRPNRFYE